MECFQGTSPCSAVGRWVLLYLFEVILVGVEASEQGNLHDGHCGISVTLESGNFTAPVSLPMSLPPCSLCNYFLPGGVREPPPGSPVTPLPPTGYSFNKQESDRSPPGLTTFSKCLVSSFHVTSSHISFHLIVLKYHSLSRHMPFSQPGILFPLYPQTSFNFS